jgi:hypothetical protein
METKFIILIIACVLFVAASIGVSIYLYSKSCNDPNKCIDSSDKCVDIPQYYSRSPDGKCKLECLDDDVCIQNDSCIPIPNDYEKDYDTNKCRKIITFAPETTTPAPTTSVPTASVPTASIPTASVPTTSTPNTSIPTASIPTASVPIEPSDDEDEILPNDVYLVGNWKIDFRNNKLSITKNTDLPTEASADMKAVKGYIFRKSSTGSLLINKV